MDLLAFLYHYLMRSFDGKVVDYSCDMTSNEFKKILEAELKPDFREGQNLLIGQDFIGEITSPNDFTFIYYGGIGSRLRYDIKAQIKPKDNKTLVKFYIEPSSNTLWFSLLAILPAFYFGYCLIADQSFQLRALLALSVTVAIPIMTVILSFYPFFQKQNSIIVFAERFGLQKV